MGIAFGSSLPYFGSITIKGYRHKTNMREYGRFGTFYSKKPFGIPGEVEKSIYFDNALIMPEYSNQEDALRFIFGVHSIEVRALNIDPSESGLLYADIILLAWALTHGVDGIVYGDEEFVDYEFERGLME